MDKSTKISFLIFQYGSFGFVLLYLLVDFLILASGHRKSDSLSIYAVLGFSVILFLIIYSYEKYSLTNKRFQTKYQLLFALFAIPPVGASIILSIGMFFTAIKSGLLPTLLVSPVIIIMGLFAYFGLITLKYVLKTHNQNLKR
ncbi:hypothetical protein RCC89_19635 [Cytophagaceae bacterium ABcell3]|nr:hypothetical protein RCC89_19635 [Cytophagaceae bacterium ABcell3]